MAKKKIGILTSGGDCPGLNACIRGVAKASYELFDAQIIGIEDGFRGLIEGSYKDMQRSDFSGILTLGGTILGTARTPYKNMRVIEADEVDKVAQMKKNYKKLGLDCLVTLGGNGTHKTANMLSEEGLNVIGLPKTIDNDIYGTDVCFGFHTALDIATDVIDRVHTTASSHGRVMVVEIMGNKAGWLTLYAGLAGGADIVLLPELPYDDEAVLNAVRRRRDQGKHFTIVAIAEGAKTKAEAAMKKKEFKAARAGLGAGGVSARLAQAIQSCLGYETRVVVPGHIQRGGGPSGFDRVLSTRFGAYAAQLIRDDNYGKTVAMDGVQIVANNLCDIAGKTRLVPKDHSVINAGRMIGVSFGD